MSVRGKHPPDPRAHSFKEIARGYLLLPHAVPIIVVIAATTAFALVAAGGWPGSGMMVRLLGAMFGGQLAIGAANELVDADLDAISKPDKPIPAGLVSPRGAWIVAGGGLVLMTVLGLTFGPGPFLLCAIGTFSGIAYSLWFKRTVWSWIPYLVALPLLPIWVWASLDSVDPRFFAVYPIGTPAVVAVQIAQSLPDIAGDGRTGVRTLAVALGETRAIFTAWGSLLAGAILAVGLAPWILDNALWIDLAAAIALTLVIVNAAIWRSDSRRGVMACFPCLASGAVVLGVGWTASLVAG